MPPMFIAGSKLQFEIPGLDTFYPSLANFSLKKCMSFAESLQLQSKHMKSIPTVALGSQGLRVPVIGLGCMGMTKIAGMDIYGEADEVQSIATIHRSLEMGGNFLDTADLYGPLSNERLIAKAIRNNRHKYIIATKFGFEIDDNEQLTWKINGQPNYVIKSVERSLKNLGTDYIDLYYLHRLDPNTPIEETVQAMGVLMKAGKVKYIGLSEVSAATIKKAHAVYPITAIQTEYSLFERGIEATGIMHTLSELGIGFVAYSPLSRGFLNGELLHPEDLPENDFRRSIPRFQGEMFYKNLELVEEIRKMSSAKNITMAQLAIAWVIAKGAVAIPGTKRVKYLEENIGAKDISLNPEDLAKLDQIVPLGLSTGNRYDDNSLAAIDK